MTIETVNLLTAIQSLLEWNGPALSWHDRSEFSNMVLVLVLQKWSCLRHWYVRTEIMLDIGRALLSESELPLVTDRQQLIAPQRIGRPLDDHKRKVILHHHHHHHR